MMQPIYTPRLKERPKLLLNILLKGFYRSLWSVSKLCLQGMPIFFSEFCSLKPTLGQQCLESIPALQSSGVLRAVGQLQVLMPLKPFKDTLPPPHGMLGCEWDQPLLMEFGLLSRLM